MQLLQKIFEKFNKLSTLYLATILIVIGCITYAPSLQNDFVWDDSGQILRNKNVQNISHLPQLFALSTFVNKQGRQVGVYYKPLMSISFAINYALWGESPIGFHFFSAVLHIINTILVFALFLRIGKGKKYIRVLACCFALLFLIHPANVESVAYISSLQELLYVFFLLISVHTIQTISEKPSRVRYVILIASLLCSLLSKESGILAILLIGTYTAIFCQHQWKKIGLCIVSSILLYLLLRLGLAHVFFSTRTNPAISIETAPLIIRIITIPYEMFSYLRLFFFPANLYIYQLEIVRSIMDSRFFLLLPIVVIVIVGLFVLAKKKQSPALWFFFFWMVWGFGMLTNLIPFDMTIAERWMYGPIIGALGFLTILLTDVVESSKAKTIFVISIAVYSCFFFIRTLDRISNWKDEDRLFGHDIQYEKESCWLDNDYGTIVMQKGDIKKSRDYFFQATKLCPKEIEGYSNLAVLYAMNGQKLLAKTYFNIVMAKEPWYKTNPEFIAKVLYFTEDNPTIVTTYIERQLQINPTNSTLAYFAALEYKKIGNISKALYYAQKSYYLYPTEESFNLLNSLTH